MISTICLSFLTISNISQVEAPSGDYNLSFGDLVSFESSDSLLESVRWSFECSNDVNIMVFMATADDFDSWNDANFNLLSSGSTSNSGKFTIPQEDTWVILFMHSDLTHPFRTASVHVSVTFSLLDQLGGDIDWDRVIEILIIVAKIGIPIIVGLILLRIIVAIVRSFKQKKKQSEILQPQKETVQESHVIEDGEMYCQHCGKPTFKGKSYCGNCGEKIIHDSPS